jgi:antitoxin (DNA-binding transcriptional repressor) of toxin-antitoxin stability system
MKALSIHETKTHMSKLLHKVDRGDQIVFGARGQAQYQITKFQKKTTDRSKAFGAWNDKMWVAPDAFDKETDKLVAEMLTQEDAPNSRHKV